MKYPKYPLYVVLYPDGAMSFFSMKQDPDYHCTGARFFVMERDAPVYAIANWAGKAFPAQTSYIQELE